ncbi:MAG: helicase-associated domain-containing protein, partial [Anaerolineales bacterium]
RAFFDTSDGPQEFAYIPSDLIPLLPNDKEKMPISFGEPAAPHECAQPILANDHILDHACTLLAASRIGLPVEKLSFNCSLHAAYPLSPHPLYQLLTAAGLISDNGQPEPEATRKFLEASREEGLAMLAQSWLQSDTFNELGLIPELHMEGEWANDPKKTRGTIINFLSTIPTAKWWSMNAFIASIHLHAPDFQRPAGDYDSWFIRKRETGEYLRGFAHWDEVDGCLLRYMISGPMNWLGIVDLAIQSSSSNGEKMQASSFRLSAWSEALLNGNLPAGLPKEVSSVQVSASAKMRIPRLFARSARYQIARFCEWESEDSDIYRYILTPNSLTRAKEQGLSISHLLALLHKYSPTIPPNLVRALERWEQQGSQASLEELLILRLKSPRVLQKLRDSRAARFLGDPLGPTAVIVKFNAWEKVVEVLAEMGYLTEIKKGVDEH